MPFRIDVAAPRAGAAESLIELGALDLDASEGSLAAILPDSVALDAVRTAVGQHDLRVTSARSRDDGSVWMLAPRPVRVGAVSIVLHDSEAFGTGMHATTALCLEALQHLVSDHPPRAVLDVGTGTGVLALAALKLGAARAVGVDIDAAALESARANAELNGVADRLELRAGGPEAVSGSWPLVLANIRAAELMEMAPVLTRRVSSGGHLVLSGIPRAVAEEVAGSYVRLGMAAAGASHRDGWTGLIFRPTW